MCFNLFVSIFFKTLPELSHTQGPNGNLVWRGVFTKMCHSSTKTKKWQELEDCHLTGVHCRIIRMKSDCPMLDPICLVPIESWDWDNYGNIDIYVIKLQHIHRISHCILASLFHLTKFCQFYSSFPEKSIYCSNIPYANPPSVIHHWKATGMTFFLPHNP